MQLFQKNKIGIFPNGKEVCINTRFGKTKPFMNNVYIEAVNPITGKNICMLMRFDADERELISYPGTKDRLESRGYDTTFAKWNFDGSIKIKEQHHDKN